MEYHSHTGLKTSHPVTQKHRGKTIQQHHLKSLIGKPQTEEVRVKGIEKLREIFIKNNWNVHEEHHRIYFKVCKFIEENYKEK